MANVAWLIPVFPIASWAAISLFGQRVKGQGDRIGIAAVSVALALSVLVLVDVIGGGAASGRITWAELGSVTIRMGYRVDAVTAVMLVVVTLVSLLVHVYSLGYMHGDARYKRYYAVLSLFTASMLGLVLADNFLLLFIFWELVGLCSFLLIGHWYEQPGVGYSALKAFLTTRVGDIGMFIGIMLVWLNTGTFEFAGVADAIDAGVLGGTMLSITAVLLFLGAVGKSAQFPLHVWLPDAMAGPTSVSALIHAATMVAAGIYLVARAYDVFAASATALTTVAWVGGFTAIFAASIALVQNDIKRVLAFSTVSQLGFMMLALGVGGYTAALFHLVTHAIFKALLFLASGSVIHGADTQDMKVMGGLRLKMPVTFWTWLVGAAALAGIPPLAGFWSKEEILLDVWHSDHRALFWIALTAATMTAFYITRATLLTFFGEPRDKARYERARESPISMTAPLVILAAIAVVIGFVNSPVSGYWLSRFIYFGEPHLPQTSGAVMVLATLAWVLGIGVALSAYLFGWLPTARIRKAVGPVYTLLQERYYVDAFYDLVFVKGTVLVARVVGWFDRVVVDGLVNLAGIGTASLSGAVGRFDREVIDGAVNGVAVLFRAGSNLFRKVQSGLAQTYMLTMFVTVVVGLLIIVLGGF